MRVLIVDDEAYARRRLARILSTLSDVEIVGQAQDGLEALALLESTKPDLLFLDIQMPELDGFGVIRALSSSSEMPLVIFATSYDEHALAAFEANAIAYLLKPIELERLTIAMDRVRKLLGSSEERAQNEDRIHALVELPQRLQRIVCRKGSHFVLLDPADIFWFHIEDGGIVRAETSSENYWVNYQMSSLEAGLDPELFFRARREVLVNLSRIKTVKSYDRSTFLLTMADANETELLVSERQAKELRRRLPGL
jgi:two-component system, LytTR family, response regulator